MSFKFHLSRLVVFALFSGLAAQQAATTTPAEPIRHGVLTPGVSLSMSAIKPQTVFPVSGSPDWSVVTGDSLWVTSGHTDHVVQLLASTNKIGLIADVPRPCSGLVEAFGSIWSPSCGKHQILRIEPATGKISASIAADPANSEGGITSGDGSVWIVIKPSTLVRIDPRTNTAIASIPLPSDSENPLFSGGFVWISSYGHDQLLKVDPSTASIVAAIPVGPKPRFLTAGAGSIWTLNQGDGSISRVDQTSGKLIASIPIGVPGMGGEITFGNGMVWATMFDFPITEIDPASNKVVRQWGGPGGDGIRFGLGSVWLSNGQMGNVWRISTEAL